jgi:hypothetical protein
MVENLSYGTDCRGDYAYFIESSMLHLSGWVVKAEAATEGEDWVFFRVIKNGVQTHRHGWLKGRAIQQWG